MAMQTVTINGAGAKTSKGVYATMAETLQTKILAAGEVQSGEVLLCIGEGLCDEGKPYFKYVLGNPVKGRKIVMRFFDAYESMNEIRAKLLRAYADAIAAKVA